MEALTYLKFWRPLKENQTLNDTTTTMEVCSESELDEGDDSFFELELTVSEFDNKQNTHNNKQSQQQTPTTTTLSSLSSTDVLSKRKILPIEPSSSSSSSSSSLLKSAPKLRVAIFKKPKIKSMATQKTEKKTEAPTKQNKLFTIKFKVDELSNLSMFTRAISLRRTRHRERIHDSSSSSSSSSKRFSKDVIQKYLKLIKPLYVKVTKKNDKMGFSGELKTEASSPPPPPPPAKKGNIPAGFKHLGKSKSASASASVMSPVRIDDSLLLQHDGIQSAILHCKNSFNSRDSSSLSRSTSTSSQETFCNLYSKDSSLLSRFSSDSSSSEFVSARKSNELGI